MEQKFPFNQQAEATILSYSLSNENYLDKTIEFCTDEDFYVPDFRSLFKDIRKISNKKGSCSLIDLPEKTRSVGETILTQRFGGFEASLEKLKHYSARRSLILAANRLVILSGDDKVTPDAIASESSDIIDGIVSRNTTNTDVTSSDDAVNKFNDVLIKRLERRGFGGLYTGYGKFDYLTGTIEPGQLVIVAARPAMGKTAFAQCLTRNLIHRNKNTMVLFFSIEMATEQILDRFASIYSKIPLVKIRSGLLNDQDLTRVDTAMRNYADDPIYICDKTVRVHDIKMEAKKLLRKNKGKKLVIVVDYLQLVIGNISNSRTRENEISEISRQLKCIAKDLECTVISLAQLNRNCEFRNDKRPMMADLRESGGIEQDADIIAFLYRESVYNEDAGDEAELIVRKNRFGEIGIVPMLWKGEVVTFEDVIDRGDN